MPSNSEKIWALVTLLAETFRQPAPKTLLKGYELALSDVPFADLERAVQQAMRTLKFMPAPVELRELAGVVEIKPEDRVAKAWACLMRAMRKNTCYTTVRFDDGILNATIHGLCGWVGLFDMDTNEFQNVFLSRFKAAYLAHLKHPPRPSECGPLIGLSAQNNGDWRLDCGFDPTPGNYANVPVFIATDLPPLVALPAPVAVKLLPTRRPEVVGLPAPANMLADLKDARIGRIENAEEVAKREREDLADRQRQLQEALDSRSKQ